MKKGWKKLKITLVKVVKKDLSITEIMENMTLGRINKEYMWSTLTNLLIHSQSQKFGIKAYYCCYCILLPMAKTRI